MKILCIGEDMYLYCLKYLHCFGPDFVFDFGRAKMKAIQVEEMKEEMKVDKVKTNESCSRVAKIWYMGLLLGNE